MKPSLLILSTEAVAEMLHDHYMQEMKPHHNRHKMPEGHTVNLLWRDKVNDSHFIEQLESWRIIAERCIEEFTPCIHIPSAPLSSASADTDARDHHLTTGTASLAPEQKDFDQLNAVNAHTEIKRLREHVDSQKISIDALVGANRDFAAEIQSLQNERADYENRINRFAAREVAAAQRESEQSENIDRLQKRLHRTDEKLKSIAFALADVS